MTKVIILGEATPEKPKKPIEFINKLNIDLEITKCGTTPREWDKIELICSNYNYWGIDLMFAYNEDRNHGVLYFGHFNDGIVE